MATIGERSLESALPSLIDKLEELSAGLNPEERVVFGEIIESAARHTALVQADDEGDHDKARYLKPKSVHSTTEMKRQYLELPRRLGLDSED